jgi:hypothetical protein
MTENAPVKTRPSPGIYKMRQHVKELQLNIQKFYLFFDII